ncbi:hypothetical protein GALL_339010 [mine drainage metagenome]|uniref:Uncharacterized protein n=1 Tax=mine drainage metagenome TaxID=410659 RepID=A0A1J5QLF5_9ZZZZ
MRAAVGPSGVVVEAAAVSLDDAVLDHQRELLRGAAERGQHRVVGRVADEIQPGQPGVDVRAGVIHRMVVVPKQRRALVVRVVASVFAREAVGVAAQADRHQRPAVALDRPARQVALHAPAVQVRDDADVGLRDDAAARAAVQRRRSRRGRHRAVVRRQRVDIGHPARQRAALLEGRPQVVRQRRVAGDIDAVDPGVRCGGSGRVANLHAACAHRQRRLRTAQRRAGVRRARQAGQPGQQRGASRSRPAEEAPAPCERRCGFGHFAVFAYHMLHNPTP